MLRRRAVPADPPTGGPPVVDGPSATASARPARGPRPRPRRDRTADPASCWRTAARRPCHDRDQHAAGSPSRVRPGRPRRPAAAPAMTSAPPASATTPAAIAGATSGTTTQVDHRRQHRQPAERDEDDRQGRGLGGQRHAEALCEPARHPAPTAPFEPVRRAASPRRSAPRSPATTAGTRRRRSSAGSETSRMVAAQPSAAAARPARPLSRASSTTPAISAARTTDAEAPAKAT